MANGLWRWFCVNLELGEIVSRGISGTDTGHLWDVLTELHPQTRVSVRISGPSGKVVMFIGSAERADAWGDEP
jgi:hypothetical protein